MSGPDPTFGSFTRDDPRSAARTGTSRWQLTVGAIGLLVVLWVGGDLFEIVTSGESGRGDQAPPSGVTPPGGAGGHQPPAGGHGGQQP